MEQNASPSFNSKLDPFGIGEACLRVQQAWLAAPQAYQGRVNEWFAAQATLQQHALQRWCGACKEDPAPAVARDERFQDGAWTESPYFDWLKEQYLVNTRWVEDSIEATPGIDEQTRRKALFWVRQGFNACSPSNFFFSNPQAMHHAYLSGGASVLRSWKNMAQDAQQRDIRMVDGTPFVVGKNLAATAGDVVYRNELVEVLQYSPTTAEVHAIPIVIVAPWINKYYILDLNPAKSLVKFLVGQGFTVFMTSWKNPTAEQRDTGFDDYLLKGVLQTIEVARTISGSEQVHAVGYCIGGTALSTLMAWLNAGSKRNKPLPVAHWTLFTALTDFTDPGEVAVFTDEESIQFLEEKMAGPGYLDGADMAWTFRMLRSNGLIWHYVVHNYLYGEEPAAFDVLYWNTDCTRLPAAMHSYYLRQFYLHNRLVQPNSLVVADRPIDLGRIEQPLYAIGTEQDHIAPWKETFKVCGLVKGPVRYALATSGHILGIVNPPSNPPKRHYWVGDAAGQKDAEAWRKPLERKAGSWWTDWAAWLGEACGPLQAAPKTAGCAEHVPIEAAPGSYVLER
jgi:polyhydroxyalkanoate synthase subunit PhaC